MGDLGRYGRSPRRSIISRLLITFCVAAVLIAAVAIAGYITVTSQNAVAVRLIGRDYVLLRDTGRAQRDVSAAEVAIAGLATTGQRHWLRPTAAARADFAVRIHAAHARVPGQLHAYLISLDRSGGRVFAVAATMAKQPSRSAGTQRLAGMAETQTRAFYATDARLRDRLVIQIRDLGTSSRASLTTALFWGLIAVGLAALLGLVVCLTMLGLVSRPLRDLTAAVRRLTAGDRSARAPLRGSAEVREVARAINTQADEADRMREREEAAGRVRAQARVAGSRIREHLVTDDVLREARQAVADVTGADRVYLHLISDGRLSPPVAVDDRWLLPDSFLQEIPEVDIGQLRRLLRTQASRLIPDPDSPDAADLPEPVREVLRRSGVGSCLLTPFGVGTELTGVLASVRLHPSRPWSGAEIDAVESIASDLGRGLSHARMYEEENRLVIRLQELDRAKSDFFATVSHELRNPLTSIQGYIEMLGDEETGPLTAEQHRILGSVARSATRLSGLIEDVFTLASVESGAFSPAAESLDLAELADAAVTAARPAVTAARLQLTSALPDTPLPVRGDAGQLERVFANLLSNAVKFTPEGGTITVTGAQEDGSAVIRVTDTGIGIPDEDQEKLFTRFFRASNATQKAIPGSGLGLAIVRSMVQAHGGDLSVESQEDEGTTVTVRLPLATASASA